ncbi:hypothetical protein PsYK624_143790 [Phanerochaete sordida]|uniref:Uncharacterized protein n=1 Tax=Phanerochaete sordida TaxID=48140 RepID=A0A9P3LLD0_9APHY|nr:hypothetical protein PsYK624_143790 [Phanerochaete sordida]
MLRVSYFAPAHDALRRCLYIRPFVQVVWEALVAAFLGFLRDLPPSAADYVEELFIDGPIIPGCSSALAIPLSLISESLQRFRRLRVLCTQRISFGHNEQEDAAGTPCIPTYPLERLALYIAKADALHVLRITPDVKDLAWDLDCDDTSPATLRLVETLAESRFGHALERLEVPRETNVALLLRLVRAITSKRPLPSLAHLKLDLPVQQMPWDPQYPSRTAQQISGILACVGATLHSLTLEVTAERTWGDREICGRLGLWQCGALRELRLELSGGPWYHTILSHAHLLLEDVLSPANTQANKVTFIIDLYEDLQLYDAAQRVYREFDTKAIGYLARGLCAVRLMQDGRSVDTEWRKVMTQIFPALHRAGALEFA